VLTFLVRSVTCYSLSPYHFRQILDNFLIFFQKSQNFFKNSQLSLGLLYHISYFNKNYLNSAFYKPKKASKFYFYSNKQKHSTCANSRLWSSKNLTSSKNRSFHAHKKRWASACNFLFQFCSLFTQMFDPCKSPKFSLFKIADWVRFGNSPKVWFWLKFWLQVLLLSSKK
jgi:hypothetical protein